MAKLELLSRTQYDANGVQTVWDFNFAGGYILPEHVKAYYEIGSVRTPVTVSLIGANQAYIVPAVPAGAVLTIYRDTPKNAPLVDFVDRGTVSEVALDTVAKQAVFAAAESSDSAATGSVDVAVAAATAAQASALAAAGYAVSSEASKEEAEGILASIVGTVNSAVASVFATLAAFGGAALIGFKQLFPGSSTRTAAEKLSDLLHIRDFGGSPSASAAVNTAALTAAITAAQSLGKGGVLIGPGGVWEFTPGTNWATRDVAIVGTGKPIISYSTGSGRGFVLDAGGSGSTVRGMRVENFIIRGNPNITDIFYSRGMVAGKFSDLEAREGSATGFSLNFSVLNTYKNLRVSNDSLGMTTTPTNYFKLDNDGTAGTRTQCNTFINCDASGKGATSTSDGWLLVDSTLNTWLGGTAESCAKGVNIASDECRLNTFTSFDVEDNQVNDVVVLGTGNVFNNCGFLSLTSGPNIDVQSGKGTVFNGGYIRLINLSALSRDTSFVGVGIDENLSTTLGIQGAGTYTTVGCTKIGNTGLVTGTQQDRLRDLRIVGNATVTGQVVSEVSGRPAIKANYNIVGITGAWTPLYSVVFSGFWVARDSTGGGVAFGTCDSGVPEVTVISNRMGATVEFSLIAGILNARTTAGTASRTLAVTATAIVNG